MKKQTFLKPEVAYLLKIINSDIAKNKAAFIHLKVWIDENNPSDPYYQRQLKLISLKIEMSENCKLKITNYQ